MKVLVIIMCDRKTRQIKSKFTRSLGKLSEIVWMMWYDASVTKVKDISPDGIILTGSTYRVERDTFCTVPVGILKMGIPVLGICYGYQTMALKLGGKISSGDVFEDAPIKYVFTTPFEVPALAYRLRHYDSVVSPPFGFKVILETPNSILAISKPRSKLLGILFHPEYSSKTGTVFFAKWLEWISAK